MRRVLILVEGDTEERIVKDVLVPHLLDRGVVLQVTKVTIPCVTIVPVLF